ncbi:major facilitator superfamily domain-containing protein [Aspergillus taichungensis]|uniref:Lysosomal dipeptide transporter MFSD1 n=1 Tax=Aspergillus taichungensis TaxID=482145 RepID=A0A2J5HZU3_9EURO|nr:major facilitator superfamily domain-containing protein [Aspergillus taichungensis]
MKVPVGLKPWWILLAVSSLQWGTYFVYDLPATLSVPLQLHLGLSASQFAYLVSALYAAYCIPNTISPFFSGFAVHRYGERSILLATAVSIISGQLIFCLAIQTGVWSVMILGRTLVGLGGEISTVLATNIATRWFRDGQISLALALMTGTWQLGTVTNSILTPRLVQAYGVLCANWIGSALSMGILVLATCQLLTSNAAAGPHVPEKLLATDIQAQVETPSIRQFPRVYWQIVVVAMLGYGATNTFPNSAQRFLASRFYQGDQSAAGSVMGIPHIISCLFLPLFGFLLDHPHWIGNPPSALLLANVLLALVHLSFLSSLSSPVLPLCLLGLALALYSAALWSGLARCVLQADHITPRPQKTHPHSPLPDDPSAPYDSAYGTFTPPHDTGEDTNANKPTPTGEGGVTALGYGIVTSVLNTSTAVVSLLLGLVENAAGFDGLEVVFVGLALAGAVACVSLGRMW